MEHNDNNFIHNEEFTKKALETNGYVIYKNFPIHETIQNVKAKYFEECSKIGKPIPHDKNGLIIWDIKTRATSKTNGVVTYSEHSHMADLHTDSQYSIYPEDYFALLTLKKAQCGGGLSYILTVNDIIEELGSTAKGKEVLQIIQETEFPFIVPNVFKKNNSDTPEFNFGKILEGEKMRFRVDTIQKAIDYDKNLCTHEQIDAFNFLVNLVRSTKNTKSFFLENGDLIFINNKTVLHGRSAFTDHNRHLLRIRMNKL